MHTSDNFLDINNDGINPFRHSTSCEMCSLLKVFLHMGGWRGHAVYIRLPLWCHHACIAMYSPRKAALTWSWWYRFICGWFCLKITQFDCYDVNDRGWMETDHVFASGALIGWATMHSWGRPAMRCARSNGRPHLCMVVRPTTAPDTKTWSIPTTTLHTIKPLV